MIICEQYKKNKFTLAPFGIEKGQSRSDYFCTPRGAAVIGWTGVDGIHYCTVKSLGPTVFAVNPYADPKKHAFPVAEDFETFLRLLITCGHESVIEQAHTWSREEYDRFALENPITPVRKAAADALAETYSLTPMDDPYVYLKQIYDSFDFDTVPYKKDYYEWVPVEETPVKREWKVYYSTCGETGEKGERAGKKLPIGKNIPFAGYDWYIPCAYVCRDGMVLDMLAEVPAVKIRSFYDKWSDSEERESDLSEEERMAIEAQNPFGLTFTPILLVNGRPLRNKRGSGKQYVSEGVLPDDVYRNNSMEDALEHYGLSAEKCWMLRRFSFPWETASKPKIRSVGIRLRQDPVNLPGIRFHADAAGQKIMFTHPITGIEHTLTVTKYEVDEMRVSETDEFVLPTHYAEMTYTVTPEIPREKLVVRDIRRNDSPKRMKTAGKNDIASSAIGIIGGADGPTAVVFARKMPDGDRNEHTAISAVTYEKQTQVEWMMVFREVSAEEADVRLIQEDGT